MIVVETVILAHSGSARQGPEQPSRSSASGRGPAPRRVEQFRLSSSAWFSRAGEIGPLLLTYLSSEGTQAEKPKPSQHAHTTNVLILKLRQVRALRRTRSQASKLKESKRHKYLNKRNRILQ